MSILQWKEKAPGSGIFERAWRGEEKLWKISWVGFILYVLLLVAASLVEAPWRHRMELEAGIHSIYFVAFFLAYIVLLTCCVWRCRKNVKHEFLGYVAVGIYSLATLAWTTQLLSILLGYNGAVHD